MVRALRVVVVGERGCARFGQRAPIDVTSLFCTLAPAHRVLAGMKRVHLQQHIRPTADARMRAAHGPWAEEPRRMWTLHSRAFARSRHRTRI
jgi:hypothetical protein